MAKAPIVSKEMYLRDAGFDSLPTSWDVVQVEDLLSEDRGISVGVMYPGKHDPNGIPLIKAGDLVGDTISPAPEFRVSQEKHEEYRRTEFQGGEILMTLVGNVGQCAVVPSEMKGWNAARAVAVIRLAQPEDAEFVRHCFLSKQLNHLMNAWANTTVQPTLNLKEIRKLPLPWPPKPERDAIASILGALDDKIELNRRMNVTLESLVRAIFKSWFVDFDPVRINAEKGNAGQMPASSQALATHDPKVLDLFPSTFQDSELGPIPEGWEPIKLESILELAYGKALKKSDRIAGVFPVYGSGGLTGSHNESLVEGPGVIVGRKGSVGTLYWEDSAFYPIDTVFYVKPRDGYSLQYIFYLLQTLGLDDMNTDAAVPGLNRNNAYRLEIPNVSQDAMDEFTKVATAIRNQIARNDAEIYQLATARDALLPQLLSGELPIPAALTRAEEALA